MKARLVVGGLAVAITAACGTTVPLTASDAASQAGSNAVNGTSGTEAALGSTGASGATATGTTGAAGAQVAGTSGAVNPGGSSGVTKGSGATGSTGAVPATAPGQRVTTPLKIGVLTLEYGAAVVALGVTPRTNRASNDFYKAIIKALNASGGVGGRSLVPTYYVIDVTDDNYQSAVDAACAAFRDAKVEVVVNDDVSTDYGFARCLTANGIALISSMYSSREAMAGVPGLYNPFNPTRDRGYGAVVDQLVASGYVTTKSKIGVIRTSCPEIESAWKNSVLPRMRTAHLAPPIEYTVDCLSGFQDAGAHSSAMQSAVLRFRSSNVDRVLIMSSQETLLLRFFAQNAQNQDYHPGYALSSSSIPFRLIGDASFPQQQLPQVRGVGWHPLLDTGTDTKLPPERRCVGLATQSGAKPASLDETFLVHLNCSNLLLLEAAVRRGDGRATIAALSAAVPALGTSFASPGVLTGTTQFGPNRQDGPQMAAPWAFNSDCTCFRYVGKPALMR